MEGGKVFNFVLESSFMASFLIIFILIIRRLFKKKLSPRIVYYFWVIVLIKLIIPYGPESSFSLYSFINHGSKELKIVEEKDFKEEIKEHINININNLNDNRKLNNEDIEEKVIITNGDKKSTKEILERIAFISWITVSISLGCYGFISYIKLNNLVKKSKKEDKYKDILEAVKKTMGIKRKINVIETDFISSPCIYGIFKSNILIPKNLGEKLSKEEISYIFYHEITHLKNGDLIIAFLVAILKVIHWFNPFFYVVIKKINEDCELACDYSVLKVIGEKKNIDYGKTIITVVESMKGNKRPLGVTSMCKNKRELKGRIEMIAGNKKFGNLALIIGVLAITMVASVGLTSYSNEGDSKDSLVNIDSKKDREEIEGTIKNYINALNNNSEDAKKEITNNFYDNKLNEVSEINYSGTSKLGEVKSIEIEDNISSTEVVTFVRTENTSEVFGVVKVDNKWKIESIGFSPRVTGERYYENSENLARDQKIADNKVVEYMNSNEEIMAVVNSGWGGVIRLPKSFDEIKRNVKVGEVIKRCNNESKRGGYDFSEYLGKEVYIHVVELKDERGVLMAMARDGRIVGFYHGETIDKYEFRSIMMGVLAENYQ